MHSTRFPSTAGQMRFGRVGPTDSRAGQNLHNTPSPGVQIEFDADHDGGRPFTTLFSLCEKRFVTHGSGQGRPDAKAEDEGGSRPAGCYPDRRGRGPPDWPGCQGPPLQDAQFTRLPDWSKSVLEDKVAALHQALRHRYPEVAEAVGRSAGKATTDYLLDNRISARAQELISMAPKPVALWLLGQSAKLNARHFGGSGELILRSSTVFELRHNPILRGETAASPVCHYHAAAFERMYKRLVDPGMICREAACEAAGDEMCRFELTWASAT